MIPACPHRRGLFLAEAAAAVAGLAAIGLIVVGIARERNAAQRAEQHAAAFETAQNLLARIRRDPAATTPAGWTIERQPVDGAVLVRVRGEGVTLATVVRP
jgi:hypothetical protein